MYSQLTITVWHLQYFQHVVRLDIVPGRKPKILSLKNIHSFIINIWIEPLKNNANFKWGWDASHQMSFVSIYIYISTDMLMDGQIDVLLTCRQQVLTQLRYIGHVNYNCHARKMFIQNLARKVNLCSLLWCVYRSPWKRSKLGTSVSRLHQIHTLALFDFRTLRTFQCWNT